MCELFPRFFRLSVNKESSVGDDYLEISRSSTVSVVPFRRNLRLLEEGMYKELLSILTNLFLCRGSNDSYLEAFYFWEVLDKVLFSLG